MKKSLLSAFALLSIAASAQSWNPQATNWPMSYGVDEISIVDANTAWITACDGSGSQTYPKMISKTTNGGTTWTPKPISGPPSTTVVGDIAAVDGNTAYVVTAPTAGTAGNGVWKTTDGGSNWTKQNVYSTSSFANLVYFWDANNGWTCGDPVGGKFEMFKTSDGGATWNTVSGAPAPSNDIEYGLTGVKAVSGDHLWVGTTQGRILHSSDRGSTWTANFSPVLDFGSGDSTIGVPGSYGHMAFKDGSNGLLIAVDNDVIASLYESTDGGENWEILDTEGTWFFGDIAYVPGTANTYVSTGVNSDAEQGTGSAYTTDGGHTWTIIDNIPGVDGGQRGKVSFHDASTGWCGYFSDGENGAEGIFKFNGTLMAVSDATVKSNLKVYPNPASDVVNISSNKDIKAITVLDMSGKKVQSFQTTNKQINVSSLAKGTYILQVYYGNGAVENTKLIKK